MTATDQEGFFSIEADLADPILTDSSWVEIALRLEDTRSEAASAKMLVPFVQAQYGVISDIDDTILFTGATNLLRMAKTVLLGNAFSRLPFKGVGAFYRALVSESERGPLNPIFYVSSSPWNLYDVLRDLFEIRAIPAGPLLLQDFGIESDKSGWLPHRDHKLAAIQRILSTYPALRFILIGDSGQHDPEIYSEVLERHPGRILAIYIRDASTEATRDAAVRELARKTAELDCDLILAEDTFTIAQHAVEKGWVEKSTLSDIIEEIKIEPPPKKLETVLNQQV